MKLIDAIEFNPTEKLSKNTIYKKVGMENLSPYYKFVDSYDYEIYSGGAKFRNGDTLVARITPCLENGKTAFVDLLDNDEIGFGSTEFIVLRNKKNITIPEYVYYLSISSKFREKAISLMNGTSGRQRVQLEPLKIEEFNIPPIPIQTKTVKVLKSIDDKIKLNNKINKNLEEYTNILFESKILNNKERDSWKEYVLSEFSKVINGYSYKGTELVENSDLGLATIKNFERAGGFKLNGFKDINPDKCKTDHFVNPFEVLVACTDLTQNADIIGNAIMLLNFSKYKKIIMSMDIVKLVPITDYIDNFTLFSIVNSRDFKEFALGYKSGTTVLHLNKKCFNEYKIKLPDKNILKDLSKLIGSNYKKIAQIIEENRYLSQLRDTLLPKLMNGEIDLSKVEI